MEEDPEEMNEGLCVLKKGSQSEAVRQDRLEKVTIFFSENAAVLFLLQLAFI